MASPEDVANTITGKVMSIRRTNASSMARRYGGLLLRHFLSNYLANPVRRCDYALLTGQDPRFYGSSCGL
jgi:hypothetical protein